MSHTSFALSSGNDSQSVQGRRQLACAALLLTELNPHALIDHPLDNHAPVELHSFGTVREPCPKCRNSALHLILRQSNVRMAHLLCADCHSCYDAHYASGAAALAL